MPILDSAKKQLRASNKKRLNNDSRRRALREQTKTIKTLVEKKDKKTATEMLSKAYKAIDKAMKTGVIKKNTASRKKSRLAKSISALASKK